MICKGRRLALERGIEAQELAGLDWNSGLRIGGKKLLLMRRESNSRGRSENHGATSALGNPLGSN
jgi:hypothetical protein